MPGGRSRPVHKPRELRRRIVAAARLRDENCWSDASILNVSSRGLQIHTTRPLQQGSWVEVRRGDLAISAQVVWRNGARAGLRSDGRIPVEALAAGEIGAC